MTDSARVQHDDRVPRKQILVIEDSADIREALGDLLELENYVVIQTEHGQAALNYLSRAEPLPHLILLDLLMPVMDGYQFLKVMKATPKISAIPIIIMTANQMQDAKSLGTEGFLRKPIAIDLLLDTIKSVLNASNPG